MVTHESHPASQHVSRRDTRRTSRVTDAVTRGCPMTARSTEPPRARPPVRAHTRSQASARPRPHARMRVCPRAHRTRAPQSRRDYRRESRPPVSTRLVPTRSVEPTQVLNQLQLILWSLAQQTSVNNLQTARARS